MCTVMSVKCASKTSMACLLLGTFTCPFLGLVSSQVLKTPMIQLNRTVGESALLTVRITSDNTVSIVKWIFHPQKGEANDLGRFSDGKWVRWNTSDSFGQRLETVDGPKLKINNLMVKDSGVYKAHVTFSTGVTESHTFSLAVYEPLRELQITPKLISSMRDGCNVTLHCQASGKGDFRVSWKRGNPLRALDKSLDWHQLSDSGEDLHLFWHCNTSDANIICLVSNPVDQKNISFNLLSLCPAEGKRAVWWILWPIQHHHISLLVIAAILLGCLGVFLYRKINKTSDHKKSLDLISRRSLKVADNLLSFPPPQQTLCEIDENEEHLSLSDND